MAEQHNIFVGLTCSNCSSGKYVIPKNEHPSYVECDTCSAIHLTYLPMSHQEEFHSTPYIVNDYGTYNLQIFGIFGGYGSAKSRSSLQEFFLRCLENPNGTGACLAQTLAQLKKTSIKTLTEEIIPPPLIETFNKTDMEITLVNGFRILFLPTDDDEKVRSLNLGLAHMEEASGIKESIYAQLLVRMRDPFTKNRAIFVCSNPEQGWLKSVLVDNDKRRDLLHPEHEDYNENMTVFIWETKLNTYLPPDFMDNAGKGKPEWWKRKYFEGSFEAAEGAVYPNFQNCVIDPLPYKQGETDRFGIPLAWERVTGMDWGRRNPTAVVFGAIDPANGELIIYNEYYEPDRLLPDHAEHLKPLVEEIPFGRLRFMVGDPSIGNKTDVMKGKSVQGLFQEYGLYFSLGNNNIEAGILKVNSFIERGKLKIYYTCANTVREHLNYKYPELDIDSSSENLDEKPVKQNEHSCDALRYLCMRLPDDIDLLVTESAEPPRHYGKKRPSENEYQWNPKDNYDENMQMYQDWSHFV